MAFTPLKSKSGIGFENANASSIKVVSLSILIIKVYQKSSLKINGPKKSNSKKTNKSWAKSSSGLKPRKLNHVYSHSFHNFKKKEHAPNVICHYCGVIGHKNFSFYIRKTHFGYSKDGSLNTNP